MDKQAMNVDEIAEMALWRSKIYNETEFISFGPGLTARAQVTCAGLREVAPIEIWTWEDRWSGQEVPEGQDKWKARVQHNGVSFYALFSEAEKEEVINPMLPDPTALSQHEPTSQTADSRDSAGLGAGPPEPFTPSIRTLPPRAHGHPEGCECDKCTWIAETLERSFPLRQAESY